MLMQERHNKILELLDEQKSITVLEIKDLLNNSEYTVIRDLSDLHDSGKLVKVFGGAVALEQQYNNIEHTVDQKNFVNTTEKITVAKYAASLIEPNDFIYLDAGTTTGYLIDYITEKNITIVTNAVVHAQKLAKLGVKVILLGGELKASTEAIVGTQAISTLESYYFSKGYFGTNGITKNTGYTTPDVHEALVKSAAMKHCKKSFVLADVSKFDNVSSVNFGKFEEATIITNKSPLVYKDAHNVIIVD